VCPNFNDTVVVFGKVKSLSGTAYVDVLRKDQTHLSTLREIAMNAVQETTIIPPWVGNSNVYEVYKNAKNAILMLSSAKLKRMGELMYLETAFHAKVEIMKSKAYLTK